MMRYVRDPIVSLTISFAVLLGSIGYLVVFELRRNWRKPRGWSVLTQLTLGVSAVLLVLGATAITAAAPHHRRVPGSWNARWRANGSSTTSTTLSSMGCVVVLTMRWKPDREAS
jgi:Trk-type K+ transport system membrane component